LLILSKRFFCILSEERRKGGFVNIYNINKKLVCFVFLVFLCSEAYPEEANISTQGSILFRDMAVAPYVQTPEGITFLNSSGEAGGAEPKIERPGKLSYLLHAGPIPDDSRRISYGAILDLRYHAGLSYDFLRKNLPGRSVSLTVSVPISSVSPYSIIPNRLKISVKSVSGGVWAEYYGSNEWTNVKTSGNYTLSVKIPEEPFLDNYGQVFNPEDIALISIDYFIPEGARRHSYIQLSLSDLKIDGIAIDPEALMFQKTKNGECLQGLFLDTSSKESVFLYGIGNKIFLEFSGLEPGPLLPFSLAARKDLYISIAGRVPEQIREKPGNISLDFVSQDSTVKSFSKDLISSDPQGNFSISLPITALTDDLSKPIDEIFSDNRIFLRIETEKAHSPEMPPVIIDPVKLKQGELIPFDTKWKSRDIQDRGAYPFIHIDPLNRITPETGITATKLAGDLFQMRLKVRLTGGIDWDNPFYRVEILREFDNMVDLTDHELEMRITPLTDTTDAWQKPYRARIGLLDINGQVMMGPNISLSQGLPSTAALYVSTTEPLPKGLVMPDFDTGKVRAIIVNFEASHGEMPPRDIEISLSDLVLRYSGKESAGSIREIDFSRQARTPEDWEITRLIESYGGHTLGINYPFPKIDVPADIMKVPLVYPSVGRKPNAPIHLGLSSPITKNTVIKDFTLFAEKDLTLVRLFVFGGLEGVFEWDERGKDIYFGDTKKGLVELVSQMKVEDLAVYLNENWSSFLTEESPGKFSGLERHVIKDLVALLDIHETVEKRTGIRLMTILSLYDFKIGEGVFREGPYNEFLVGEHPEVVTVPEIKVKAHALVWKILKILSADPRFYRYIAAVDVMNEPGNATVLSTKKHFPDLVNFVGETMYLAKDAVGPKMPVSVGSRSWPLDLIYWRNIAEGIDVLKPHYWESLESYNINTPGLWPLEMPYEKLWDLLNSEKDNRPTGIGEINPGANCKEKFLSLEKAGYDFALLWSYSGHDGHDAKLILDKVEEYQKGNVEFARMAEISPEDIKKAFEIMSDHENPATETVIPEKPGSGHNENITEAINIIIRTAELKGIELNKANLAFLKKRSLSLKRSDKR
jgi:hypothetical protein